MKEKIEKFLKRNLKRKLAMTTATLIAFLLSSNLAVAQNYQVGNDKIERKNLGTWEDATEYLKKTGLFRIENGIIENRLKYESNFKLLPEVNKTFINKGKIATLTNSGIGKIENRAFIYELISGTTSDIENFGYIVDISLSPFPDLRINNIFNKVFIYNISALSNHIKNEGHIDFLNENKNLENYGSIENIGNEALANTKKIENYGIINFENKADYNTLNMAGKLDNKGIVLADGMVENVAGNSGNIKNYNSTTIADTKIDNGILNAYEGTIDKNLELINNSIFNLIGGEIEANKTISFNNSTANIYNLGYKDKIELKFENNSSIGRLYLRSNNPADKLKKLTLDNTTKVGYIGIEGDVDKIELVANENNKNRVLRINNFFTDAAKNVNTFISTNVDLLENSQLGNITVKDGGRLTIGRDSLFSNGVINSGATTKYYKKDIKIEGNGKILIGVDPYDIAGVKELGEGNNLDDSVVGQNKDENNRKPQSELNIDADSLLHDIVLENGHNVNYEGLGLKKVRNKYKIIEVKNLPGTNPGQNPGQNPGTNPGQNPGQNPGTNPGQNPGQNPGTKPGNLPEDYNYLNDVYHSLRDAGKVKHFSVYNGEQLDGLFKYLRDIYANNPYTVTTETSFTNLAILRDKAFLDLRPNLNKWAVMGGLTYNDRENKYKLSTTNIDVKTTGAYAKGEYGLREDTSLGLILGGTNSKTDLSTGKVKGSSLYLGAYAKKYVNNFKFTLETGMDFGEYKVDRDAIGYAGIIETSKQSAKQKNRAFDLYTELRYSQNLGNNFYLEPNLALAYSVVKRGSATENDGKVNLHVESKTYNQTKAELGLDLKKVLLSGNTSHSFVLGTSYERILSGAKATSVKGNVVGGREFDILVPEREKDRANVKAEYKLENKVGVLFNLKMDYGFKHGSNKRDTRFSTGLGYRF